MYTSLTFMRARTHTHPCQVHNTYSHTSSAFPHPRSWPLHPRFLSLVTFHGPGASSAISGSSLYWPPRRCQVTLRIFFSRLAELKVMRPARVQSSFSTCDACARVRARACVNRWRCIHAWQWMVFENGASTVSLPLPLPTGSPACQHPCRQASWWIRRKHLSAKACSVQDQCRYNDALTYSRRLGADASLECGSSAHVCADRVSTGVNP